MSKLIAPVHPDKQSVSKVGSCEAAIICDRCAAVLAVKADSREEATAKLQAEIATKRWRVVSRWDTTAPIDTTIAHTPDLCSSCLRAL